MKTWETNFPAGIIRFISGVRLAGKLEFPAGPVVFYANHSSHLDFVVIWAALPDGIRQQVRPVAGRDYWTRSRARQLLARNLFNALLIERIRVTRENNPVLKMRDAVAAGSSLIVFPEGTRGKGHVPGPFKSGLYHFHRECPETPLVPVSLQNLNRILPKGAVIPIPLISHLAIGSPLTRPPENRQAFLDYARQALLDLNKP